MGALEWIEHQMEYFIAISKRKVEHPLSAQGDIKFGALGLRRMESARA